MHIAADGDGTTTIIIMNRTLDGFPDFVHFKGPCAHYPGIEFHVLVRSEVLAGIEDGNKSYFVAQALMQCPISGLYALEHVQPCVVWPEDGGTPFRAYAGFNGWQCIIACPDNVYSTVTDMAALLAALPAPLAAPG